MKFIVIWASTVLLSTSLDADSKDGVLHGNHLKIIYSHNPPYDKITKYENGTVNFKGTGSLLADWWARRFKLTISFVYANEEQLKRRGINAAAELLIEKEGDVTSTPFGITADRMQKIEFCTFPAWQESFRLVVPRPGEQLRLFALVRPFDNLVWLLIVVSIPVTVLFMSCLSWAKLPNVHFKTNKDKLKFKRENFAQYTGTYALYTVNIFTNHGDNLNMSGRASFTIFVSFWLLGVSVLVYVYSSTVITSLSVPALKPSVNSFEDLLKSDDVVLILRSDLYWGLRIMSSNSGILGQLAVKVQNQPESLTNDPSELDKRLTTGRFAYPFAETFVRIFIANQYKKDGKCRFQESDVLQEANLFYYSMVQKQSKITRPLSLSFIEMWETGILQKWKKDMQPTKIEACLTKNGRAQQIAQQSSIKLIDLSSAFFVLGVGASLSFLVFTLELIFASISSRCPKKDLIVV